jgi:hypothetical protein
MVVMAKGFRKIKEWLKKKFFRYYLLYKRLYAKKKANQNSDVEYVRGKFKKNFGVYPDLKNPKRYNEHISRILLTPPDNLLEKCVDKYEVREYVREKVGAHILNDIYGIYNNVKELEKDWPELPNQFVLKATHGCAWNYICKDKRKTNFKEVKTLFRHWLKSNFYHAQRELVYKNLKPRILAEKYLEDESGGLIDYKFHCFHGRPEFINVIVNRFSNMKLNTYDMDWNFIDVHFDNHYPNDPAKKIEKPAQFEKMKEYSRILSEDFEYVRVDFYLVEGNIYFGELTFTPGNGAYTSFSKEDDLYFGSFFNK